MEGWVSVEGKGEGERTEIRLITIASSLAIRKEKIYKLRPSDRRTPLGPRRSCWRTSLGNEGQGGRWWFKVQELADGTDIWLDLCARDFLETLIFSANMVHKSFFEDDAPSEPIPTSAAPDLPFPLNGTSTSAAPSKKQRLQPITTTISSSNPAPNGLDNKSKKAKQQQQQQSNSRNPHDKSKAKVVSYHESDEEEERHEGLQLPYNPSGANGDGNGGKKRKQADGEGGQGERARERQQLQAEKERLKEQRVSSSRLG
jgi:hypothetical protein